MLRRVFSFLALHQQIAWISVIKFMSAPMALITGILFARLLGAVEFGSSVIAVSLSLFLSLPIGAALATVLMRESAALIDANRPSELLSILRATAMSACWYSIVAATIVGVVCSFAGVPAFYAVSIVSLMVSFGIIEGGAGVLRGAGRPALSLCPLLLIRPIVTLMFVALLCARGPLTIQGAMLTQVAGAIVAALVTIWAGVSIIKSLPTEMVDLKAPRSIRGVYPFFLLLAATGVLNIEGVVLALGAFSNPSEAAAFRVSVNGGQFIMLPLVAISMIAAPKISAYSSRSDRQGLSRLYLLSVRRAIALTLLVAVPGFFFADIVIRFLFGTEISASASRSFKILAMAHVVASLLGPSSVVLQMAGLEKVSLKIELTASTVICGCAILLSNRFGAGGASASVLAGVMVRFAMEARALRRGFGLRVIGTR